MKLSMLLATGFESADRTTVVRLAEAALAQGHEVSIFLTADGCYVREDVAGLAEKGALLACCAKNAEMRGLAEVAGVHASTQYICASMVAEADRVVAFV